LVAGPIPCNAMMVSPCYSSLQNQRLRLLAAYSAKLDDEGYGFLQNIV
jgi:hypothetical protein